MIDRSLSLSQSSVLVAARSSLVGSTVPTDQDFLVITPRLEMSSALVQFATIHLFLGGRTCECLMGCVCRCSRPGSRMTRCHRPWSTTGTSTPEWLLRPVATTTGCLRNPPSSPRGLNQRERKVRRQRGVSKGSETKWTLHVLHSHCCLEVSVPLSPLHAGCVLCLTYYDIGPSAQPQIHLSMYCYLPFMISRDEWMDESFTLMLHVRAGKTSVERKPKVEGVGRGWWWWGAF